MCSPVAFVIHHQILSDRAGVGSKGGCQNLLLCLLEVLWVKYNETSVMGGASVITPMTHSPSSTTQPPPTSCSKPGFQFAAQPSLTALGTSSSDPEAERLIWKCFIPQFIKFGTRYCLKISHLILRNINMFFPQLENVSSTKPLKHSRALR